METKKIIDFLQTYFTKNRRRGHTIALLNGVKSDKSIMLIVANMQQKNNIDLPKEQMITIDELDRLRGTQKPIVIDHFAIQEIFYHVSKLLKRGEKYKKIYEDLEEKYKKLPFSVASGVLWRMRQLKEKYFPKSEETINWKDKFYELEEEFEEVERELKREIEHWKSKYYNKGV